MAAGNCWKLTGSGDACVDTYVQLERRGVGSKRWNMRTTVTTAETTQEVAVTGSGENCVQHTSEDVTHGGATKEGVDVQLLDVRFGGRTCLERELHDYERTTVYEVHYGMKVKVEAKW